MKGHADNLKTPPGQTSQMALGYSQSDLGPYQDKELFLNVYFSTRKEEALLAAGTVLARAQLPVYTPGIPNPCAELTTESTFTIDQNDRNWLIARSGNIRAEFSRHDGFITRLFFGDKNMLEENSRITPNFWRAPTDNDFGASLQLKYIAWRNPQMEFKGFEINENVISAAYELPQLKAVLTMTYRPAPGGGLQITQQLKTLATAEEAVNMPPMFRFGVRFNTPKKYNHLVYYGRGPGENYPDRSAAAFTGLYRQSVSEQFYPYIRPQENGTHTGLRWWKLLDHTGSGICVDSESLFSASALHYSIESLDSGPAKRNLHSRDLQEENFTQCCIDLRQMGLGCINAWGGLPQPGYMLPYGNYSFTFTLSQTNNKY